MVRLFRRMLDAADYAIISVRLRLVDWIGGPELPTPADRQREAEHDRLQRAFPAIDIDHKGPKR
jgi:hypothetical protein